MIGLSDKKAFEMSSLSKTYEIAGKKITFETGKLALLANGSVTISDEEGNVLLVTAGIKNEGVNENGAFFPLVCDYQDKFYATGKIGGNRFQKREGKPSETAVLTSRLIDRPIRPMFKDGFMNDTQIIAAPLSLTSDSDLGFFGVTGASLSLLMAGAPFEGPVSGVKIALTEEGNYIFDPSFEEVEKATLTLIVAGTFDAITMVEAEGKEVSDAKMVDALSFAHKAIKEQCEAQNDFLKEYAEKFEIGEVKAVYRPFDADSYEKVKNFLSEDRMSALYGIGKDELHKEFVKLEEEVIAHFALEEGKEDNEFDISFVSGFVNKRVKEVMRKNILDSELRLDKRGIAEVRPIKGEASLLPRVHGSALFQRGMTQALTITTLGGPDDALVVDDMLEDSEKRYLHHYNFPPYSVGDVRPLRGVGRREVGHGKLAEKALLPVLPSEEEFPYVMRVVSEITTCNGSSSMASVCGSSMSLMDAGVPIKSPVAGVAMGMIYDEESGKYKILSDIQAQEDFLGDMDFKVARTEKGITAMQLDVKIKGLSMKVFEEAFEQSNESCGYILENMAQVISENRKELSPYAPSITKFEIDPSKISAVIGRGGENVQRMERDYEVSIFISDEGVVTITSKNQEGAQKTKSDIDAMLWEPKIGESYDGVVFKILDGVGALVSFKGKTGMIHISKLQKEKTEKVQDVVNENDKVKFEIIDIKGDKIGMRLIEKIKEA